MNYDYLLNGRYFALRPLFGVSKGPQAFWRGSRGDGPGIAPEHQPHIFERFYRADQSCSDRTHSGLGLCIAKKLWSATVANYRMKM